MKKTFAFLVATGMLASSAVMGDLIISQYVETDSGTTPKGIELWNSSGSAIDFSSTALDIRVGVNGGAPASVFTLNTGSLGAGQVMVVGTSDMGTYLDTTFGVGVVQFHEEPFTYNGDDALTIYVGGVLNDVFGNPGSDPGTAWTGSGVSSANQNISLNTGITTGDTDGWTDPSTRFSTVSTNPSGAGGLEGFGVAVPEPGTFALFSLGMVGLSMVRRRMRA